MKINAYTLGEGGVGGEQCLRERLDGEGMGVSAIAPLRAFPNHALLETTPVLGTFGGGMMAWRRGARGRCSGEGASVRAGARVRVRVRNGVRDRVGPRGLGLGPVVACPLGRGLWV